MAGIVNHPDGRKAVRSIRARVPARICLAGENLDWMGLPTLTVTADALSMVASATRHDNPWLDITSIAGDRVWRCQLDEDDLTSDPPPADAENRFEYICRCVVACVTRGTGPANMAGWRIALSSGIPLAGGLASSGAVHIALAALLSTAVTGRVAAPRDVAEIAYAAEHDLAGVPCGRMDQYAIALGGIQLQANHANRPPDIDMLPSLDDGLRFVVGWTAASSSFVELGRALTERYAARDPAVLRYADRTAVLVDGLAGLLRTRPVDGTSAGAALDHVQRITEDLVGPPDPRIATGLVAARAAGALGAKSLGARGSGGALAALVPRSTVTAVVDALTASGLYARDCGVVAGPLDVTLE